MYWGTTEVFDSFGITFRNYEGNGWSLLSHINIFQRMDVMKLSKNRRNSYIQQWSFPSAGFVIPRPRIVGSLSARVFETRTAIGREHFASQGSGVSQIFILIISNGEKKHGNEMCLCEDKLKGKTTHFLLPSASQKRACLSSLETIFHVVVGPEVHDLLKSWNQ